MRTSRWLAVIFWLFATAAADAADAPPQPVALPAITAHAPAFDWSGYYYGLHAGGIIGLAQSNFGVHAGYNVRRGDLVYGVDLRGSGMAPPIAPLEGFARLRLGRLIGDRVLVFGAAGGGTANGVLRLVMEVGGGIEIALGERFSIRGEVNLYGDFECGFPCGSPPFWSLGLTHHPGSGSVGRAMPGLLEGGPYIGAAAGRLIFAIPCGGGPVMTGPVSVVEVCYLRPDVFGAAFQAGYLVDRGPFVFGPELQIGAGLLGGPQWAVAANLRAGFSLSDTVLVYAEGGVGLAFDSGLGFTSLGAGLEFGLWDRTSVFVEAKGVLAPDLGPDFVAAMIQVGVNFWPRSR